MTQLVECIPNFSEARRPEVIAQILDEVRKTSGATLLNFSSDIDHNRTVVTFVGSPEAVEEAAFCAIAKAAELINMEQHRGEHPRIGATDVVPFVPIQNISMFECVTIAKKLAKRVAGELNIPVYLYEEAASLPERQNLENIRRGQYEGLKEEIKTNPERKPDFGLSELGSAGATVIGAREPLIAFNVYLNTDNVTIAQEIARVVRQSSGGFRFLKAMGVLVDGRAQVSMNFTNFRKTSIHTVVEAIRREAARYGALIHHTELVGLLPQEALVNSARWYLQLDAFENEQILEQKLSRAQIENDTHLNTETFIDQVAAGTPTPGGGSAAAHTGALGAALVAMVARLTAGRKKYAEVNEQMIAIIEEAEKLKRELTTAVEQDVEAFKIFMQATRLPKNTLEEQKTREKAFIIASIGAARVPLEVARRSARVMELALEAASLGNVNAISDAGSALAHARAALFAAGLNVRINLLNLQEDERAALMLSEIKTLETLARTIEQQLLTVLADRGGISV